MDPEIKTLVLDQYDNVRPLTERLRRVAYWISGQTLDKIDKINIPLLLREAADQIDTLRQLREFDRINK